MNQLIHKFRKNQFLFEELVIRDFKQKYKRTVLGMAWMSGGELRAEVMANYLRHEHLPDGTFLSENARL